MPSHTAGSAEASSHQEAAMQSPDAVTDPLMHIRCARADDTINRYHHCSVIQLKGSWPSARQAPRLLQTGVRTPDVRRRRLRAPHFQESPSPRQMGPTVVSRSATQRRPLSVRSRAARRARRRTQSQGWVSAKWSVSRYAQRLRAGQSGRTSASQISLMDREYA